MYAVVEIAGKQFRVSPNDTIQVPTLKQNPGAKVTFDRVLLLGGEKEVRVGNPLVAGATVTGTIVDHGRDEKVIVFKKRRRHNYRRKQGHRQSLTLLRITAVGGAAPKKAAAPKAEKVEAAADAAPAKKAAPKKAAAKTAE